MYETFEDFCNSILSLRRDRELHPKTIEIIKNVLRELYPNSFAIGESTSVAIGRGDVGGYIDNLIIHIEIIASRNQVRRDADLLGESIADVLVVILMDDVVEEKVAETYFRTLRARGLPIRIYPIIKLSKVLVNSNREKFKRSLKKIIETARSRYFRLLENCYWKWKEFGLPAENSELLIFSKFRHNIEFDIGHKEMIVNSMLNIEPDPALLDQTYGMSEEEISIDAEEDIGTLVEDKAFLFFIDPKGELLVKETQKNYIKVAEFFKKRWFGDIPKQFLDSFILPEDIPKTLKIQILHKYSPPLILWEDTSKIEDLRQSYGEEIENLTKIAKVFEGKNFEIFHPKRAFAKPIFFINEEQLLITVAYCRAKEELEEQKAWSERIVSEEICYAYTIEESPENCPDCYSCGYFTNPLPILVSPTKSSIEYSTNYIASNMTNIDNIFEEILETAKKADTKQANVYLKSLSIQYSNITCKCGSNSIIPVEFQKCGYLSGFDFVGCRGMLEANIPYEDIGKGIIEGSICDVCEQCSHFIRPDKLVHDIEYGIMMNKEIEVIPFCIDCKSVLYKGIWQKPDCFFNEYYLCDDDSCPLC